jgi:hypothetical protein
VIIGIALPVLAGLGIKCVERRLPERKIWPIGISPLLIVRFSVAALLFINLPWRQLPAREAWQDRERVTAAYEALRALPYGPVVEIPWRAHPAVHVHLDTQYMLASTLHWRPILNGFTAYLPSTFKLLHRVAQRLPARDDLEVFRRLTDVRWIVVHVDRFRGSEGRVWQEAFERGYLRRAYADGDTLIFEISRHEETGVLMSKLASTESRAETLRGLPRTPLVLAADSGRLEARVRGRFHCLRGTGLARPIELTLTNASDVIWPGFDYQTEGLVELRYSFSDGGGGVVKTGTAPLDADIPAQGETLAYPLVTPPPRRGDYRLRLDLVQRIGGRLRPLPLRPVELNVEVVKMDLGSKELSRGPAEADMS